MNHKHITGIWQLIKPPGGYTLMEAIIAIAVCGFGLAMILGLYGMVIKTEIVSKAIFSQSVEINSIADEIGLGLKDGSTENLWEDVEVILESKYPDYELAGLRKDSQASLYHLEIIHKGKNSMDKLFHIKVFWSQHE
ncbi:type IV pilus modification PilV family protein [Acetobacterium sp. UBA5834]|jgi:type II secretory pathway pseudopilin PulG|uniref:type IV pilus modification PilV family protein n=1 Tax=Acetobacterium sp. UBA5834 TaxID=1945907 RepID=UPI00257B82C1|nr:hypothetical protein [Acetobacterium sp. UBA5834]